MSSSRASKIEQLAKLLRKHYQPVAPTPERSVMEHLIYGCVLEDSSYDAADEAYARLMLRSVDMNEIRATTIVDLTEIVDCVAFPKEAAGRIRRNLHSCFETRYSFDLDDLKKSNLAKATELLESFKGMTKFVLGHVSQKALGGHAIPVDKSALRIAAVLDIISQGESDGGAIPGLERAIPKAKGAEFSELFHQFSVEFIANYKADNVVAILKSMKINYEPEVIETAHAKAQLDAVKAAKVAAKESAKAEVERMNAPPSKAAPVKSKASKQSSSSVEKTTTASKNTASDSSTTPTKNKTAASKPKVVSDSKATKSDESKEPASKTDSPSKTVKKASTKSSESSTTNAKKSRQAETSSQSAVTPKKTTAKTKSNASMPPTKKVKPKASDDKSEPKVTSNIKKKKPR